MLPYGSDRTFSDAIARRSRENRMAARPAETLVDVLKALGEIRAFDFASSESPAWARRAEDRGK